MSRHLNNDTVRILPREARHSRARETKDRGAAKILAVYIDSLSCCENFQAASQRGSSRRLARRNKFINRRRVPPSRRVARYVLNGSRQMPNSVLRKEIFFYLTLETSIDFKKADHLITFFRKNLEANRF